ncbi:MAG: acetyl-CoA carboxylase carboxyl transferase subunit alpha, partial [Bacteroidetes bacterium]|nr:acetyl-CoA carboxylase carboxyl transferase subunit alpha [Bacteroidota bacterium]
MGNYYLEFEKPLESIDNEILELKGNKDTMEGVEKLNQLQHKLEKQIKKVHSGLNRWQKVQLARHPERPYTLDYIQFLSPDFM